MNVAIGIAIIALAAALGLERNKRIKCGRRDNPYNLIDLQEELRRRAEARRKEEDENR